MAKRTPLPKWLRQAMGDRVITRRQAMLIHLWTETDPAQEMFVLMPPELDQAMQRLFLWQLEPPSLLLH